jgi:hypothetical protein
MWGLGDEVVWVLLVLMLGLLGAEEAKGPVGEVEAAEDYECGEGLQGEGVSALRKCGWVEGRGG